jgi:uncharacterized protein (DUF305 family)
MIVTPGLPGVNICSRLNGGEMLTPPTRSPQTSSVHSPARHALACLLTASLLSVTACADSGARAGSGARTPAPGASSGAAGYFGGTDLAWVAINIAMDEQLMPLLDLVPTHSSNPAVLTLATQVKAFHQQELSTLGKLHDQAKLPSENPHEGMPMPGMVTPDQVTEAAATKGPAFDKLLLQRLSEHLTQGASLAKSEQKAGLEPQTLALAAQVLSNRDAYLPKVAGLRGK